MFYLSEGTEFFFSDKFERAQVMQWLFFERYSHEPFIATSRFWYLTGKAEEYQEALQQKQAPGYGALGVMEQHLANHAFFTGDHYTIADIGLLAYTHVAGKGGFDLTRFAAIQSWIKRGKNHPHTIKLNLNEATYISRLEQYRDLSQLSKVISAAPYRVKFYAAVKHSLNVWLGGKKTLSRLSYCG